MPATKGARLENFTSEEKKRITLILRKGFFIKSIIYLLIIGSSAFTLIYFNFLAEDFENIGLLDIVIGVAIAICVRMYIVYFSEYKNETGSPVKRTIDTRIVKREGEKIIIGNQEFKEDDILLGAPDFYELQAGDYVRVEYSAKSHMIFSVKRILKQ